MEDAKKLFIDAALDWLNEKERTKEEIAEKIFDAAQSAHTETMLRYAKRFDTILTDLLKPPRID